MSDHYQEIEVKFYISNPEGIEAALQQRGAGLIQPRTYEINLRFDTPDGALRRGKRVLRLRRDAQISLTYKGPGQAIEGARRREEIEFQVSDFAAAQAFLEALGFQVILMYEKYRTIYELEDVLICLDEMPYGRFIELEGPNALSLQRIAQNLGLNWEARILDSYTALFEHLRRQRGLTFRDLSFANFRTIQVAPADLNIIPADQVNHA